jgi:hypothetical protein
VSSTGALRGPHRASSFLGCCLRPDGWLFFSGIGEGGAGFSPLNIRV